MKRPGTNPLAAPALQRWRHPALWVLFFGALVSLRLLLAFRPSDTEMVHRAIVESLLAGHNWGRQALVGALEYPLLPTLGLLAGRVLFGPEAGGLLVAAIAQGLAVCYLLRLREESARRAALCVLLVLGVLFLPDVRAAVTALDPNWVAAVPFCAGLFHLVGWFRAGVLRDVVLCAVNAGLLVFCGPGGIVAGLALAAVLSQAVGPEAGSRSAGLRVLVWAPFLYCLGLLFLWNWLILGDILFCVRGLWEALAAVSAAGFVRGFLGAVLTTAPALGVGVLILLASAERCEARALRGFLILCAGVALGRAFCLAVDLFPGSATLLAALAALAALALIPGPAAVETVGGRPGVRRRGLALAAGALALLVLDVTRPPAAEPVAEGGFSEGAPARGEITALIDRDWPRSRTALYGVRLAALYHDPLEERFVARMDYHEGVFEEQARREVMHLLLPPPDGRFYNRGPNAFTRIHAGGSRILLLEKQWPAGWQLWRCVIFPDKESRLRNLR